MATKRPEDLRPDSAAATDGGANASNAPGAAAPGAPASDAPGLAPSAARGRDLPRPQPVGAPPAEGAPPPDGVLLVLSTFESREQAEPVARTLIEERLAACVNLLPGCRSIYRWQGAIEQADETLMLVKTTRNRYAAFEKRLLELHPYDLPELVALAPDRLLPAYASWVIGETRR